MVEPGFVTPHTANDTFLVIDGLSAQEVWMHVDAEHNAGRPIWLTGELVEPLARRFGVERGGRVCIQIAPYTKQPEWVYRLRDIVVSSVALLILAPILAIIAVLVKISSPGPVFYQTTAVGQSQRPFVYRKFRSMRVLDPEQDRVKRREQFRMSVEQRQRGKVIDATRLTRVGAFLRQHSLDELPQLWNVLTGDMGLVGPRPCLSYEIDFFPHWAFRRFQVRAGMTGVWQVAGRGMVMLEQGLMMDVYYANMRTFTLDLRLALDTVRIVLLGEGDK